MYIQISENHKNVPSYLTMGKKYLVVDGYYQSDIGANHVYMGGKYCHHIGGYWEIYSNVNRQYLFDFLKLNKIKKTLVSKYLGYSENWLTQMANDTRRDMTDETLKDILKKLHIDWTKE